MAAILPAPTFRTEPNANSLGQRQRFILEGLGVTGTVLFHWGSGSCHGSPRCSLSLNGVSTRAGQDQSVIRVDTWRHVNKYGEARSDESN